MACCIVCSFPLCILWASYYLNILFHHFSWSYGDRSIEVENALIHLRGVTGQFGPFKRVIICVDSQNALK